MIDVDEGLRALSHDLDEQIDERTPLPFTAPGRSARTLVAAGAVVMAVVLATAVLATSTDEADVGVTTAPDTALHVPTTAATPPLTPPTALIDPPVVDARPLRLGISVPGMDAKVAVERCVATEGASVCGTSVSATALKVGNWNQTFRLDPEDLTGPSIRIQRRAPLYSAPSIEDSDGGSPSPDDAVLADLEPVGPTVAVPGGVGYVAENSTEQTTIVGWTDADGAAVWVEVNGSTREDALTLIAGLRPRSTYGFDLPDGSRLVPVLDTIDHQLQVPSEIRYEGDGWGLSMSIFPGDRNDYELLVGSGIWGRNPPAGSPRPSVPERRMITMRGRPALLSVHHGSYLNEGSEQLTTNYFATWYEPTRGAVVSAQVGTNAADPDEHGLALLDQLVELDEESFQVMVAGTPQPQP